MATTRMVDMACRTDEEIARSAASTSIMSSARHVVGELEQEVDPVFQGRGSRWLRRNRPDRWEHLIEVLGLPKGEALTPWPADPDSDDAWMLVCGKEARADQAAVEAAYEAPPAEPEPAEENTPQAAPEPRHRRVDWTWQDDAICKDDGILFFAPDGERQPERDLRESLAQELCSWCPVRTACLDYALARPEKEGFWGGMNEDERATERRRRMRRAQYDAERRATPAIPEKKPCQACSVVKPAADFKRNANRPDGLASRCRQCAAQASTPTWARADTTEVA